MKTRVLLVTLLCCLLLVGCEKKQNENQQNNNNQNETKQETNNEDLSKPIVCKYNGTENIQIELYATRDSNGKVTTIEMHNIFASNEEASKEFDHFKKHGDNAVLEDNKIIIKNAHDKDTLAGQLFGDGVGKTKEEFQTFVGYYECE